MADLTPPTEHPSVAWWAACPVITDRPPTAADGDDFGRVLEWARDDYAWGFGVGSWEDVRHYFRKGWIHTASWRPNPLTLGQRIDAELAANSELSPELRELLIEAKAVVGEVVK